MLEVLVHANLSVPPRHHQLVRIAIPDVVRVETVAPGDLAGWDAEDVIASRRFGDQWLTKGRTAVLRVPSVVTDGREYNVVINPTHPEGKFIQASVPETVRWDRRLFRT